MSSGEELQFKNKEILNDFDKILSLRHEVADDRQDQKPCFDPLLWRPLLQKATVLKFDEKRIIGRYFAGAVAINWILHDVDSQEGQLGESAINVVAEGFKELGSSSFGSFWGLLYINICY